MIQNREQIVALENIEPVTDDGLKRGNVIQATLVEEAAPDFAKMKRHFFASSSCGICGKASIDAVRSRLLNPPNPDFRVEAELLLSLPEALRSSQDVFQRTGGLHAAALFDSSGGLLVVREDIGRHNAVDKVIGWALREGRLPLTGNRAEGARGGGAGTGFGFGAFEFGGAVGAGTADDAGGIFAWTAIRDLFRRGTS